MIKYTDSNYQKYILYHFFSYFCTIITDRKFIYGYKS